MGFVLLWSLLALLPAIAPVARRSSFLADRYAYFVLPAVGLLVCDLLTRLSGRSFGGNRRRLQQIATIATVAVIVCLGTITYHNASRWRSETMLWKSSVQIDPDDPIARFNLASAYHRIALINPAIEQYRATLALDSDYLLARYNLSTLLFHQGTPSGRTEARDLLEGAIRIDPRFHQARVTLAALDIEDGRLREAEDQLREALAIDPGSAPAWLEWGHIHAIRGRPREAIQAYEKALELKPGDEIIRRARDALRTKIGE